MKVRLVPAAIALAIAVAYLPAVAADLPKRGSFNGKFGWSSTGQVHEIGPDRVFFLGGFSGTFFNDAGEGFLHGAAVWCPGVLDLRSGQGTGQGYCTAIDQEGDKAFLSWSCGTYPCSNADFDWIGGTGKYQGIRGRSKFGCSPATPIPGGSAGYCTWTARWELP